MCAAGFADVRVEDASENPARVASARHAARERRAAEPDQVEGAEQNASTQRSLRPSRPSRASGDSRGSPSSHGVLDLRARPARRLTALGIKHPAAQGWS